MAVYHGKPCPRCGEGHSEGDSSCRAGQASFFDDRLAAWNRYKQEAAARREGWEAAVLGALYAADAAAMREALTAFPECVNVQIHNVVAGGGQRVKYALACAPCRRPIGKIGQQIRENMIFADFRRFWYVFDVLKAIEAFKKLSG